MTGSPLALLEAIAASGADFVVIGGMAVVTHGHIRTTRDLDITYATDRVNLDRLGELLVRLDSRLRGVDEVIPFVPDGRTLRYAELLTLQTNLGALDLFAAPPGAPSYDELKARAERIDLGEQTVLIAAIADLVSMKRAAGRPRDFEDIAALESIERLRADSP